MSQKILILHSAPVKRVEQGILDLRQSGALPAAEITVLSRRDPEAERRFRAYPSVGRVMVRSAGWSPWRDWARLRRERFDGVVVFFTGERGYWKMKAMALGLFPSTARVLVHAGDGEIFELG